MEATSKTLQVNTILFESNDTDVLLKGTVVMGHMQYNTDVLISNSMLNRLVSQLQRDNEGFDFAGILESEPMEGNGWMYSAQLNNLEHRMIDLAALSPVSALRQVRA